MKSQHDGESLTFAEERSSKIPSGLSEDENDLMEAIHRAAGLRSDESAHVNDMGSLCVFNAAALQRRPLGIALQSDPQTI